MNSLRSIWNQMPTVRLLIPFIVGIVLCIEIPDSLYAIWIAGGLLAIALSIIIYVNTIKSVAGIYRWRYASGVAVSAAMLSMGYLVTFFHTDTNDPHHIAHMDASVINNKATYTGTITDPVVLRDKTVSVLVQLEKATKGDTSIPTEGKVLASLVKDSLSEALQYGDQVIFSGMVTTYEDPKNPGQFDYRNYQALHHIYHRVYLRNGEWKVANKNRGNPVLAGIYLVRAYFLSLIVQTVKGPNELAVATAIMLGYRDYVSDEVMQAYAGSGVLHILSVSGLHVAVLYYVLSILLGWMDGKRKLEIIKGVIVIIIILFYACLTGLSPPVLRSAWMFTLIIIARLLDRDISMYNVLAVSCLVLLIWDPYFIADVGFQLSYIAVLGIVYLYPMFHGLVSLPSVSFRKPFDFTGKALNYLFDFAWGLICVSIAAQLATFPISLYYFQAFPNLFLLSNLLVIPLSNFVLISGMALFAVGWWHWLLTCAGWIFDHLLIVLNRVVFWVEGLPFALTRGVEVNTIEMILCYLVIMMICWYIADRRAKVLIATLVSLLILCASFAVGSMKNDSTQKLMVYDISGKRAIAFILHRQVYYDFDTALINNENLIRYNIGDHWWQCGIEKAVPVDSTKLGYKLPFGTIYTIHDKRIVVIDKELAYHNSSTLKADILILSGNTNNTIDDIQRSIDFGQVVFDTSNKPYRIKQWKGECEKLQIKYHDCRDHAFEMDI